MEWITGREKTMTTEKSKKTAEMGQELITVKRRERSEIPDIDRAIY